jgi:glycosyltransferase involved in cell wall biosynthesis
MNAESRPQISVLLPTCDRSESLEKCLVALNAQRTSHTFEVIVIDNSRRQGQSTKPNANFPHIRRIAESRPGLSCARNAGIRAASGNILVFTDDDTLAEPDWLENLVAPLFSTAAVAAVTGQTVPLRVETEAERLFEAYGGLGGGKIATEFNGSWLRSKFFRLPLWQVGTTANAAFRASLFRDSRIGLMEERLGAGSPAGAWEDLYIFYRILRAGYVIAYRPSAKTCHAHRQHMADLTKQLQAYRRGEVAFCLLSLLRDREWRAILHLFLWIPYWRIAQLLGELLRRTGGEKLFRFPMLAREWIAYFEGPVALFRSHHGLRRWQKHHTAEMATSARPSLLPRNF